MKGMTMLSKLQTLGMVASFSRPATSNDNPYSEALFRTMKYRPTYPDGSFGSLAEAQGRHPERWGSRDTRAWKRVQRVHLNPAYETLLKLREDQAA